MTLLCKNTSPNQQRYWIRLAKKRLTDFVNWVKNSFAICVTSHATAKRLCCWLTDVFTAGRIFEQSTSSYFACVGITACNSTTLQKAAKVRRPMAPMLETKKDGTMSKGDFHIQCIGTGEQCSVHRTFFEQPIADIYVLNVLFINTTIFQFTLLYVFLPGSLWIFKTVFINENKWNYDGKY